MQLTAETGDVLKAVDLVNSSLPCLVLRKVSPSQFDADGY